MTIEELRDYFSKLCGEGKGDGLVCACNTTDNPTTDNYGIVDALYIENKKGDFFTVLLIE